ncbi:Ig domain-containing protein [Pseudomonas sp. KSR10]|jgi:hypothetical protein|uniref:putative Ig domain-containing protein n=1 Tax=Pseudomonas sp. KSR10 TaxID=2916654 RepID=UPI001EF8DC36|nr:putative Ig domain-containing protein [Pseudomonas sp. KSR10]MCG6539538.1 Ig domain-containing protein [Pseudomonas sp. KSR10]
MLRKALCVIGLMLQLAGCETVVSGGVVGSCAMRPEPTLLPEALPTAKVGVPYSVQLSVTNTSSPVHGIYVSDAHPLPDGLSIHHQNREPTGHINGTPIKAGAYEVHISAGTYGTQCASLRARRVYTLEVAE